MSLFEHKLDGFTLAEVIVTLALTSMALTFAYGTLTYVQKLFYSYKDQNRFMQEYTEFKKRMDHEALFCEYIIEIKESTFQIKRDSLLIDLEILKDVILVKNKKTCDTFHLVTSAIQKKYELMEEQNMANKLVRSLDFEVGFSKQKFNFCFDKNYDATVKLKLNQTK